MTRHDRAERGRGASQTPTGTYRLQLGPELGFEAVGRLAAHLGALGVSHVYFSPVLQAAPGSTHGYDVVNHSRISAELGGAEGLRLAAARLREHGIGIVLDVVPNHMAVPVPESRNPVLWAALRDGPGSAAADWFDIAWDAAGGRVVLPTLGEPIEACLDGAEISVDRGGGNGGAAVRYYEHELPLRAGTEDLPVDQLLPAQHYRPAYWRVADEELNYRRFFDVDSLIGIRVERPEVFDASHAVILDLVEDGTVQGLRIDHPDGLADPRGYLDRLAAATVGRPGGDRPWVIVEKILVADESLPDGWNCDGTTGYDAIGPVSALFVHADGGPALTAGFAAFTSSAGPAADWNSTVAQSRRDVLAHLFGPEVNRLVALAEAACRSDLRTWDHSRRGLTEALIELLVTFDVYRAYVEPGAPAPAEAIRVVEQAAAQARANCPARSRDIGLISALALGRLGRGGIQDEFCVRFQQTTGPVMAKGVEDTACYRWFPLSALDEVGVRPDRFGIGADEFHGWAGARLNRWPATMNASSTHDTKRSEDVRARLFGLTEIPAEWLAAVNRLPAFAGPSVGADPLGARAADRALTWLCWQSAVGAWPIDAGRLTAYLRKAAREAKLRTSWIDPDVAVEQSIEQFVEGSLADSRVVAAIETLVARLQPAFVANVLGQRAVQLLLPGIPDIYQGCEAVALTLVDPDNRRAQDFDQLASTLERGLRSLPDPEHDLDAAKARLTALVLRLRRERPDLCDAEAEYLPLQSVGARSGHVTGYLRRNASGGHAAVLATRYPIVLDAAGGWTADTAVALPPGPWRNVVTGQVHDTGEAPTAVADLVGPSSAGGWPVAVLVSDGSASDGGSAGNGSAEGSSR